MTHRGLIRQEIALSRLQSPSDLNWVRFLAGRAVTEQDRQLHRLVKQGRRPGNEKSGRLAKCTRARPLC